MVRGLSHCCNSDYSAPGRASKLSTQGVIPVEGLDLQHVGPGLYTVYCMPLKIVGSEGAPGRCALSR